MATGVTETHQEKGLSPLQFPDGPLIRWIDGVIQRSLGVENGTRESGVPISDFITSMRLLWLRCVRGFGLLCAFVTILTSATQVSSQSIADIVDRVKPSVAFVLSQGGNQTASGSAFVVDPAGLLVTALHVVADARSVSILLPGGNPQAADVIAVDVPDDLAVLRISQGNLPALPLADVSNLRVGEDIIAVGYPVATLLAPSAVTVTRGIISAIRPPFIQVDAAINPGNSGGPILDSKGNVIGVADWKVVLATVQGLNFAVSADAVRPLLSTARDPAKDHLPLGLPLLTITQIELSYGSGGIGSDRILERAVSCVSPPPRAESLVGVQGNLEASSELRVVTWLSFDGGADFNNPGTFAYLQHDANVRLPPDAQKTSALPNSICVNYAAIRKEFDIFGYTFKVTYMLSFKVWSPAAFP